MFMSLIGCLSLMALIAAAIWTRSHSAEPSWNGRSLSEWLEAYDNHNRFEPNDPRGLRSLLGDDEIQLALQEMREEALPVLVHWLKQRPSRLKPRLNGWLNQQPFLKARFEEDNYQILAATGFMAYHTNAQPLLPELAALSHSTDPHKRMLAYEAAFFTRPDRDIFMPFAERALAEQDQAVQAMAAQWLQSRFPDEAEGMPPCLSMGQSR